MQGNKKRDAGKTAAVSPVEPRISHIPDYRKWRQKMSRQNVHQPPWPARSLLFAGGQSI
jgi:hypothetical protein